MNTFNVFGVLFILLGCTNSKKEYVAPFVSLKDSVTISKISGHPRLQEYFIDSVNIGIKGNYKVQLQKFNEHDSIYAVVTLYKRHKRQWTLVQNLNFQKDGITDCNTQVKDYNNDGLNDLTFQSAVAARPSNEIRTLLIFDRLSKKFKIIKNSGSYPNLEYNELLDCIDSWMIYGGSSTIFLKIEADSLRAFAGVSLWHNEREIYEVGKNGRRKILRSEQIQNLETYVRFKNYDPLIENKSDK